MAVYFIRQGLTGNVKIGFTSDIAKRVRGLQMAHMPKLRVMRLFEGGVPEERAMHARFAAHRIGGEWFKFAPAMMDDVGLAAIAIPEIGKYGRNHNWPDTAWKYERDLHEEIIQIIGGADELGRRCGVAPWESGVHFIEPQFWSAAVLLLAERGRPDINLPTFRNAHAAVERQSAESKRKAAEQEAAEERKYRLMWEAEWIEKNPGVVPWWEVSEENRAKLSTPPLLVVGGKDTEAA